jgi:hypothetical protein
MAKRKTDEGTTRLLDAWEPPTGAGDHIGCVATTFTFDPIFFEEHCLSRFLRLDTDPREDGAAYLINREEKLAEAKVCVLVDRSQADGSASARWDVLPVTVPNRIFHPKVSVLAWHNWIRVVIASANLTEPGYRRNQEVVAVLDFHDGEDVAVDVLAQTLTFLEQVSTLAPGSPTGPGPKARLTTLLRSLAEAARPWRTKSLKTRESARVVPLFVGPLDGYRDSALARLGRVMRDQGGPAHSACVVSPFFDESADTVYPATTELLRALTDRGSRAVEFMVPIEPLPDGQIRVRAPRSLVQPGRKSAEFSVYPVSEDEDREARPLHAKSVWLWNDYWHAYMIGSSNFTASGLALPGRAPNVEANVAYIFAEETKVVRSMEQSLPASVGDEIEDLDAVSWAPIGEDDGEGQSGQPVLPAGFEEALFEPAGAHGTLTLHLGPTLPSRWILTYRDEAQDVYSGEQWRQAENLTIVKLPWARPGIPTALGVRWWNAQGQAQTAQWPVNVTDPSRLPPPDDLRNLSLETLIEILGSRLPLHEAVARAKQRGTVTGPDGSEVAADIDPLKRVRSETFLLQRTRRVAKAIEHLIENLNRPVVHEDALLWRLRGPVGPLALAGALAEAARSSGEACFLLAEVALALRRVDAARIAVGVEQQRVQREVAAVRTEVEQMAQRHLQGDGMPPGMAEYVSRALGEGKS